MNRHNKTETDSQIQRKNRWSPKGRGVGMSETGEGDEEVQTSSHEMSESRE